MVDVQFILKETDAAKISERFGQSTGRRGQVGDEHDTITWGRARPRR